MDDLDDKQRKLALKLKENCWKDGREHDTRKSAEILHQIGLLHFEQGQEYGNCPNASKNFGQNSSQNKNGWNQPDKVEICLVKSVGLLNSALVRFPSKAKRTEIENDLSRVCQEILKKANVQNITADLVEIATQIKSQFKHLREETKKKLKSVSDISISFEFQKQDLEVRQAHVVNAMEEILSYITNEYIKIMKNISSCCLEILGPAPCKFAVVGMGSLARKEVTPYSDFEHIILLEMHVNWKDSLQYFRWYSVIFHTIILNLQETIIHRLNIKYLNDPTTELGDWFYDTSTCGISFDSMMPYASKIPLGRTQPTTAKPWTTELIRPVEEMLEYLNSEESLKNGYHLNDILMNTCLVYGNEALHDEFKKGIQVFKNSKTQKEIVENIKKQVCEDLERFAIKQSIFNLKLNLNVKQLFYRSSTLFIVVWEKIGLVHSTSCFDIINELAEQKKISENAKQKLLFATAIACLIRLNVYTKKESQDDNTTSDEHLKYGYESDSSDVTLDIDDSNYFHYHLGSYRRNSFDEILKIVDIRTIINYF